MPASAQSNDAFRMLPSGLEELLSTRRFALLLGILILAAFPDVILGSRSFFYRDFAIFGYPLAWFHRVSFWSGEIPLWNPLNNSGIPFLAQWNTLVLYPPSLIYLLLSMPWALSIFCLLHQWWGGLGMYRLIRSWTDSRVAASVAGIAFAFSGLALSSLKWPNNIAALSWMPWVVATVSLACHRGGRKWLAAVLVGALQMLSGAPEIILFTWLIAAVWTCGEQWGRWKALQMAALRYVGLVVAITFVCAIQLLPFLDLLAHSQRRPGFSDTTWSMPPWGFANFLVPLFGCLSSHQNVPAQVGQYWVASYYGGVLVLLLALWGACKNPQPRVIALVLLAVFASLLALGDAGFVYPLIAQLLPLSSVFRFPVKFVVPLLFVLPALAGLGASHLFRTKTGVETFKFKGVYWIAAGMACMVGLLAWFSIRNPIQYSEPALAFHSAFTSGLWLILFVLLLFLWSRTVHRQVKWILACSFVLLIWVDLQTHARLNPTVERWVYDPDGPKLDLFQFDPYPRWPGSRAMISPYAEYRVDRLTFTNEINDVLMSRRSLFCNVNLIDAIPKVDGFYSLYLKEEHEVRSLLYARTNTAIPDLMNFLSVSQVNRPGEVVDWETRESWMPLLSGGQRPVFLEPKKILEALKAPGFDPKKVLYLPLESGESSQIRKKATVDVVDLQSSNHRVEAVVESDGPAWLVLGVSHYHPWKVRVDGKPVRLHKANHAFQALEIPPGRHTVVWTYEDDIFQLGSWLSFLSLVCVGSFGIYLKVRRKVFTGRGPIEAESAEATVEPQPMEPPTHGWLSAGRVALIVFLGLLFLFPGVWWGSKTFFYRDFGVLAYPFLYLVREMISSGEIPLWNVFSNCGAPLLAQWGTMVLYPFSFFYLILPMPWSVNVFSLLHLILGATGMYWLSRRWFEHRLPSSLAAIAFVFNGVVLSSLMWPNYMVALGWMPWVILAAETAWKRNLHWVCVAALVGSCQMLAGVPELALLTWILIGGLWIGDLISYREQRKAFGFRFLCLLLLVSALMAVQLLPFFELLGLSQRHSSFATSKWAMPSWGWANLLLPLFHSFQTPQGTWFQFGQVFFSSTYLGAPVIALALLGIFTVARARIRWMAVLTLLCLVLALGENGRVYSLLREVLPGLGFARYPIKFVLLPAFTVPLLAAAGLKSILNCKPVEWRNQCGKLLISGGVVLVVLIILTVWARLYPLPYDQWEATWTNAVGRIFFLVTGIAVIAWAATERLPVRQMAAGVALLALLVADGATHYPALNPVLPARFLEPGLWSSVQDLSAPEPGHGRALISPAAEEKLLRSEVVGQQEDLLGKRIALWSNLNVLEKIPKVNGSSTLQVREQAEVQDIIYKELEEIPPRLADFLGATIQTKPGTVVEWVARTNALPLVTAGQQPVPLEKRAVLDALADPSFDPAETVYVSPQMALEQVLPRATRAEISDLHFSPHEVSFTVQAEKPAMVVVARSFYPAWKAYVDEKSVRLWKGNHAFQTLMVSEGSHTVRLRYEDTRFGIGAAISSAALVLCLFGTFRLLKYRFHSVGQ